ncbi:hypothetical protein, partial [Legionella maioricensis]|uniref:hypothetical protein n=1 Tax=Legionella maioricensis TaxID=2896528 RepID=UPI0020283570
MGCSVIRDQGSNQFLSRVAAAPSPRLHLTCESMLACILRRSLANARDDVRERHPELSEGSSDAG